MTRRPPRTSSLTSSAQRRFGEPAANYLQVFGDEDLAGLLDHGLRFQLLRRELAFARVKHLLARHAGQSQVGRVRVVADRNLNGVRVNGAGSVSGGRQACTERPGEPVKTRKRGFSQLGVTLD